MDMFQFWVSPPPTTSCHLPPTLTTSFKPGSTFFHLLHTSCHLPPPLTTFCHHFSSPLSTSSHLLPSPPSTCDFLLSPSTLCHLLPPPVVKEVGLTQYLGSQPATPLILQLSKIKNKHVTHTTLPLASFTPAPPALSSPPSNPTHTLTDWRNNQPNKGEASWFHRMSSLCSSPPGWRPEESRGTAAAASSPPPAAAASAFLLRRRLPPPLLLLLLVSVLSLPSLSK